MTEISKIVSELRCFFNPESVAVVGASRDPSKPGSVILKNLLNLGFRGRIIPVNPNADEILGLKAYPRVDLVPGAVDTAIIVTPAPSVPDIMRDCEKKGVKGVIIVSGGFSEEGEEGKKLQEEIVRIGKRAGIRIIGPNTTGVLDTESSFTSSFNPFSRMIKGDIAFIAQTGNFGGIVCEHIFSSQLFGISKVVGLGNKCDVDESDILEYLSQDPQTRIIAMYLEGVKDGRRFLEICKRTAKKKPILIVKGGKTEVGAKVVASHTASLSGEDQIFNAACKQAGVLRISDFDHLLNLLKALSCQPLPKGNRIAIMHFSGACLVLATDAIVERGLSVANLSEKSLKKIREVTPDWHRVTNPIDLIPAIQRSGAQKAYQAAIDAVVEDDDVDGVIVGIGATEGNYPDLKKLNIHRGVKPMLFNIYGNKSIIDQMVTDLDIMGFPAYNLRDAVNVLADMCRISEMIGKYNVTNQC
ncbi:MAG: CoA-binding protein [Candidatus Bathyarchaeia archaeon]